mgnify:FL=1
MKKFLKKENTLYIISTFILVIVLLLSLINKTKYIFFLLSILSNLVLIIIFKEILKKLKIKFTKKEKIIILSTIILVYIFYIISVITRNFIYYWDYSCYYNIQTMAKEKFTTSILSGLRYFVGSTWSGEYGSFLTFFPEVIFNFTNHTVNSYLLSCVFIFVPYIIISLSILIKRVFIKYHIEEKNLLFSSFLLTFILFPLTHATAIYAQPDYLGLCFIFLIIALTIDYTFEEFDNTRLILLFLVTYMLIITRRWYLYFLVTYYLCYLIKTFCTIKKTSIIKVLKNIIKYGLIVITVILLTLFPLIKNIIFGSIGNYSDFYSNGGFIVDLKSQISYLGYLLFGICFLGILWGIIKKEYRLTTILSVVCYLLIIYLFNMIQSMGLHHSLMLVPIYLYWMYLAISALFQGNDLSQNRTAILILSCLIVNFVYGLCNNTTESLFTTVPLTVPYQEDYEQLGEVATWLKENLNDENTAYMLTHNNKYNPDKLRNYYLPDQSISNYLPYGSAVIGVHKFPLELFTAKYIIITEPFESISIEQNYYNTFQILLSEEKFTLEKEFSMGNGYKILIYKRIKEVDQKEKEEYLQALEEASRKYPELYKNIIESY